MRKIILSIIGVAFVVGAFFGGQKIASNKKKQKPKIEKVKKLAQVILAHNASQSVSINTNGVLQAKNKLALFAEVQGIFKTGSHLFRPGQVYKKGEALVSIDASEYFSSIKASRSSFQQLLTSLIPDLSLDYPSVKDKWIRYLNQVNPQKSLPKFPEFENDKEKYFITGRGLVQSYFNIKSQEERLKKYRIYAPFTGTLIQSEVTEGSLIRPGQLLGTFIDTSIYELEINISKQDLNSLQKNQEVLLSSTETHKIYKGKISRINKSINTVSQTASVFVDVKHPDLSEGQFLNAEISANAIPNAIKINRQLLYNSSQVFVIKNNKLKAIDINPLHFTKDEMIITGVPEGSKLLIHPIPSAFEGMLVETEEISNTESATLIQ